mgnify:FL=1
MKSSGGFEVHCCSFFVEIRTPVRRVLPFQGGRGGWLLGSLGVNVGLSGFCREMDELSALRWIAWRKG